jgi:hypothetical protein
VGWLWAPCVVVTLGRWLLPVGVGCDLVLGIGLFVFTLLLVQSSDF